MIPLGTGEQQNMEAAAEDAFNAIRANADCTIYNRYTVNRVSFYHRTVIERVDWEDRKAANMLATGGNLAADQSVVTIPFSRIGYLPPRTWLALADKHGYWTLQHGDVIARGILTQEISDAFTMSDLERTYDNVYVITTIDQMDGSVMFKHWKIGVK